MSKTTESAVVSTSEIVVAQGFNPRREFNAEALDELAKSILANGITTALTVRREKGHYVLVDGERRLRAAKAADLDEVPVLIRGGDDAEVAALVANVQREDLNKIEEAEALSRLKRLEGVGTNKALAEKVGKPVGYINGRLKLLALPPSCQAGIATEEIPVAAEPVFRKIAKASPQLAESASDFVRRDLDSVGELIERPARIVQEIAADPNGPFVCEVTRSTTIEDLVVHPAHREALGGRADKHLSNNSGFANHHSLRIKEEDIDRLRASGKLLEFDAELEWMGDFAFLVDAELAADLAEELVDRQIAEREKAIAEEAKKAGVAGTSTGSGATAEALADAQKEERRRDRESAKRDSEKALAANTTLGIELVKRRGAQTRKAHRLNRAKVVARRVVADNGQLPGAGLRLALPQLREVETKTLKSGEERERIDYASSEQCQQYLLDAIERAKSVDEVLELITDAMIAAELADPKAIAQSKRISWYSGYPNPVASGLADEIKDVKAKVRPAKRR